MPERIHGGVFTDTLLTGSLQHYLLSGADFSGAVDSAGRPIAGSAAEVVFNEISLKATIVIMRPEATGASFALETNRADWSDGELQGAIRLLGTIGVDLVDVSAVTITLVPYSFREENIVSFLDLTDTPGTYAGHGEKQLSVVVGENGIEFKAVDVGEAPVDGQIYARRNSTWVLVSPRLVDSVFGRAGTVTAQAGDYDASQVDNDSVVPGASVALALNTLQGDVDTINVSLGGAVTDINDLDDVNTAGINIGDLLKWNGTEFVPVTDDSDSSISERISLMHSAGLITGGDITDNADGTVAVGAGTGMIRGTNSSLGDLFLVDFAANAAVPLVDDAINYIFIDHNAGNPIVSVSTVEPLDQHSKFNLGRVFRDGIILHINPLDHTEINDSIRLMSERLLEAEPYARVSGGLIAESGTRNISVTNGVWFHGVTRYTTPSFNSVGPDTFTYLHRNGVGGWTSLLGVSQIDNTKYDDGSGILATLTAGNHGIHWIFMSTDGDIDVIYGQDEYTFLEAGNAVKITDLPDAITVHSRIIGKIIIRKNESVFTEIFSEFHTFLDRAVDKLRNVVEDTAPQLGGNLDTNGNVIDMSVIADPSYLEGRLFYDVIHHGLAFFSDVNNVKIQIGQETVIHVVNDTGSTISKGTAVTITGTTGVEPTVSPIIAIADTAQVTGVVAADILDGVIGLVMVYGTLEGINTSALAPGTTVYLSDTVAGEFTDTAPSKPIDIIKIGTVITAAINGRLLVDARTPAPIKAIANASDVDLTGISTNDFLIWDGSQFITTADVATAAQGALADSATQPGDDISTLTNDLNFLTPGTENPYGTEYHYQESEALSNMTGTVYQTKMMMVTSNLPAGDYKISWQGMQDSSSNSVGTGFRVQVDGGAFLLTETLFAKTAAATFNPFAGFNVVTLSAGVRTITIDWIAGTVGTSSNIKEVRLELIRTI